MYGIINEDFATSIISTSSTTKFVMIRDDTRRAIKVINPGINNTKILKIKTSMTETTTTTTTTTAAPTSGMQIDTPTLPTLDQCVKKLDKLLDSSTPLSNPAKSVRRWLGFTSITVDKSKDLTLENVLQCASRVLPVPSSVLAKLEGVDGVSAVDGGTSETRALDAAQYEVELWLVSLAVKICLNAEEAEKALELSSLGIQL